MSSRPRASAPRGPGAALAASVLAGSSILWGLTWWPLKQLRSLGVEGIPLILVGYGVVALLFIPQFVRALPSLRPALPLLLQIGFLGGIANLSFTIALMYGDVVRVMVLFYLLPLWGVIGGALFLGEPLTKVRLMGMGLALVGAFLVLGGTSLFLSPPTWTDAIAVGSGFFLAMNNLSFRVSQNVSVGVKVGSMFVGCVICAGLLLAMGVQHFPRDVTAETWGYTMAFGFLILLITAATQWGVTHMEAGRSSIIMVLELLSAVASTALIARVWLTPIEALGAVLIVLASLIETRRETPLMTAPTPTSPPPDGRRRDISGL